MENQMALAIFLAGQAIVIAASVIGTYVRMAVRLTKIELLIAHSDGTSQVNHDDIVILKSEINSVRLKLEHIETLQSMLCSTCPLKQQHHMVAADTRIKK